MRKVVLLLTVLTASAAVRAETPWETYVRAPTPGAASAVAQVTYTNSSDFDLKAENDLSVLEYEVSAGEAASIDLAFRIRQQFSRSGALSEYLDQTIGRAIRANPRAYLAAAARAGSCVGIYPSGDHFVDRDDARRAEAEARIRALDTASVGPTKAMALTCKSQLQRATP
jgi:hypothetical protein